MHADLANNAEQTLRSRLPTYLCVHRRASAVPLGPVSTEDLRASAQICVHLRSGTSVLHEYFGAYPSCRWAFSMLKPGCVPVSSFASSASSGTNRGITSESGSALWASPAPALK